MFVHLRVISLIASSQCKTDNSIAFFLVCCLVIMPDGETTGPHREQSGQVGSGGVF